MPIVLLQYKTDRGLKELAKKLAKELPYIVAPNLDISERKRHDGRVAPEDIIVRCAEGKSADVNSKDIEIIVLAHDFPERKADLEKRKDNIILCVRKFLADYDRNVSGFVWVLLIPTAFGQL